MKNVEDLLPSTTFPKARGCHQAQEESMSERRRPKMLERTIILIMLGVLAGGAGGVAVGLITGRPPSSSSQ